MPVSTALIRHSAYIFLIFSRKNGRPVAHGKLSPSRYIHTHGIGRDFLRGKGSRRYLCTFNGCWGNFWADGWYHGKGNVSVGGHHWLSLQNYENSLVLILTQGSLRFATRMYRVSLRALTPFLVPRQPSVEL